MNDDVGSIYFGGGTPSILTETDLEKILNEIHKKFKISNNAEITIECNPDDVSLEKIEVWKKNSFNRVSLGIQSFIDSDLVLMNRSHNSKTAIDSIEKIKMAITGNGNASKEQVAKMLQNLLAIKELPKNLDSTDGLAAAVCHFYNSKNTFEGTKYSSWSSFVNQNKNKIRGS